ncbi:MAG: sterol-binding protein [Solirubrobacterales bacterium]|nr:sterol-binding protein [Solirubrobacterales bacterium]
MSVAATHSTHSISYQDLYQRWEQGNWKATELDFSEDRNGWAVLSDLQRRSALWMYSMFFYGEDAVTDGLSPYIDAAPTEEQKYFLATQQVDEARHSVFFHRFFKEVIGAGDSISTGLAFTEQYLNWGYRGVFDRLELMADELRRDRSLPKFAQAITLYHMVVEGTLAQPGQHFIEDFFNKEGTMPGFSAGMENVSRDEQRHIGFGVKVLSELLAESEECKAAVVETLREVMPYSLAVFTPPGWDREYTRSFGFELEDIFAFGLRLVKSRWRAAGYPIEEMPPNVFPFDPDQPEEEAAACQIKLLEAGVLGEPNGAPGASAEVQEIFFGLVANSADKDAANGQPMTVQWRFEDADPWHITIDNGSSRAEPGLTPSADLTLDTTWSEWVDISMRGHDARRAMLRRKLKPHGSMRQLMRMRKIWPPRRSPVV